jgi:hypothetical protein
MCSADVITRASVGDWNTALGARYAAAPIACYMAGERFLLGLVNALYGT